MKEFRIQKMKLNRFKYIISLAFYFFLAGFISASDHHEEEGESFGKSEYCSRFSTQPRGRGWSSFSAERAEHKETPAEYTARKERISQEKFERSKAGFSTQPRGRGRGSFSAERAEHKETPEEYAQRHKELAKRKIFDPRTGKLLVKIKPLPREWYIRPSPPGVFDHSDDGLFISKLRNSPRSTSSAGTASVYTSSSSDTSSRIENNVFGAGAITDGAYIPHTEI